MEQPQGSGRFLVLCIRLQLALPSTHQVHLLDVTIKINSPFLKSFPLFLVCFSSSCCCFLVTLACAFTLLRLSLRFLTIFNLVLSFASFFLSVRSHSRVFLFSARERIYISFKSFEGTHSHRQKLCIISMTFPPVIKAGGEGYSLS